MDLWQAETLFGGYDQRLLQQKTKILSYILQEGLSSITAHKLYILIQAWRKIALAPAPQNSAEISQCSSLSNSSPETNVTDTSIVNA